MYEGNEKKKNEKKLGIMNEIDKGKQYYKEKHKVQKKANKKRKAYQKLCEKLDIKGRKSFM